MLPKSQSWLIGHDDASVANHGMHIYGGSSNTLAIKPVDRSAGKNYRPRAANEPTIDSFIYNPQDNVITAFQITVSERHSLKAAGPEWLKRLRSEQHKQIEPAIDLVVVSSNAEVQLPGAKKTAFRDIYHLHIVGFPKIEPSTNR